MRVVRRCAWVEVDACPAFPRWAMHAAVPPRLTKQVLALLVPRPHGVTVPVQLVIIKVGGKR
jgi:hypothetical protein